jgi:hypothetical protein
VWFSAFFSCSFCFVRVLSASRSDWRTFNLSTSCIHNHLVAEKFLHPALFLSGKEFLVGLDSAFFPAKDSGIGRFHISKEVKYLSDRFHPPVCNLAVQCRKLGGIALDDEHPVANGAHRSTNNFHTEPRVSNDGTKIF